jgi:hypothetical protein
METRRKDILAIKELIGWTYIDPSDSSFIRNDVALFVLAIRTPFRCYCSWGVLGLGFYFLDGLIFCFCI